MDKSKVAMVLGLKPHEEPEDTDAPLKQAAMDLKEAMKDGDSDGIMDALKAAIMHCMMEYGPKAE
jgi:hypothetical protein